MVNSIEGLWVAGFDLHFPSYHAPTFGAMRTFIEANDVRGFIFGGDQHDNAEISHHTKGKPLFRERAAFKRNTDNFDRLILTPLEAALGRKAEKIWIRGNHERFEDDLVEEHPELEGTVNRGQILRLEERGWQVVPLGHAFKFGKLAVIHGEVLTGIGNQAGMFPAKKAVELYAGNVLAGHTHAAQSFTRISPVGDNDRWMGWISPILGATNPTYLRNRPTAWVNGFNIIEMRRSGSFNLFPAIVVKGELTYGGKTYRA